jgi:hypothetical protein
MGRRPIGERPLTAAEKMRRYRARKFGNKLATKSLSASAAAVVRKLERERDHYKARVDELEAASQRRSSDATGLAAARGERDDAPVSLEKLRPPYEKAVADQNGIKTNPPRRNALNRWSALDAENPAETRRRNAVGPREDVRADREIVEDILKELRKAGAEVPDTQIHKLIKAWREIVHLGPSSGNRKANKKYAERVISWIDAGAQMFSDPPEDFPLNDLFTPPDDSPLADLAIYPNDERCNDWLFTGILADMRKKCKWTIDHRVGEHANSGYQQERAARMSRGLLKSYKIPLHPSSPTSTYRRVASLIFEVMTGTYDVDLKRACEPWPRSRPAQKSDPAVIFPSRSRLIGTKT